MTKRSAGGRGLIVVAVLLAGVFHRTPRPEPRGTDPRRMARRKLVTSTGCFDFYMDRITVAVFRDGG